MKFLPFLILAACIKITAAASPEPTPSIFKDASPPILGHASNISVLAGVKSARSGKQLAIKAGDAFSLSQLEQAKAKALAEHKPLGFIKSWGEFYNDRSNSRAQGSPAAFVHFYQAFNKSLVLVFVRHETELEIVPEAVKKGYNGPDSGGYSPNMAVLDATASELISEVGYGDTGPVRDNIFMAAATKIDAWLKTHPLAVADSTVSK